MDEKRDVTMRARTRDPAATRARLLAAARVVVCETGVRGASARKIAGRAGVNQALVFYYFDTVSELVAAASDHFVEEEIAQHEEALGAATSIGDLFGVGNAIQEHEPTTGNIAFMAQILAAAPHDAVIAAAAARALAAWVGAITGPLARVVEGSLLQDLLDAETVAHLVAAGFIGLELYASADATGGESARQALASLARMLDLQQ